jgi:hypothetical protein
LFYTAFYVVKVLFKLLNAIPNMPLKFLKILIFLSFFFSLQRLAVDSNPAIAAAASKAIYELKKQWEIEEGDSWRFMMNQLTMQKDSQEVEDDDADTS